MVLTHLPGIEYASMPKAGTKAAALAWPPRLVVVHDTGNSGSTRYDEASFAANRTDAQSGWTSAHAYVDRGGVLGSLPLNLQAWAAYSYANSHGFHLEICLHDLHDPQAMQWAAWLVMRLCQEAGIPPRKLTPAQVAAGERGVCGHYDITVGLGVGDHTDPGWTGAEWADFMARVNGGDDMASAAEINASRNGFAVAQLQDKYRVIAGDVDGGKEVEVGNPLAAAVRQLQQDVAAVKAAVSAPPAAAPVELSDADREDIANRVAAKLTALVFKAQ